MSWEPRWAAPIVERITLFRRRQYIMVAAALIATTVVIGQSAPVDTARAVAKRDQVFVQDANGFWHIGQFARQADGMPELAHVLAERGSWPSMGQFGIMPLLFSLVIAAVWNLCCLFGHETPHLPGEADDCSCSSIDDYRRDIAD